MASLSHPKRTLAIDPGEIHFSICLAEYDGRFVKPLFLGAAFLEPKPLSELVEVRAARRRVRRTAREHRRRLKHLRDLLGGPGGPPRPISNFLSACRYVGACKMTSLVRKAARGEARRA